MDTFEYRELKTFDEFRECVTLQKEIFNLSDIDTFSPLILTVLARDFPPVGIVIGTFDKSLDKEALIGFFFGAAILRENAYWGILGGVHPKYQGLNIGTTLFKKLREFSLSRGVRFFYWTHDPLEGNLGHTNYNKLGHLGIKYKESAYEYTDEIQSYKTIPIDNVVIKWKLDSRRVHEKIEGTYKRKKIEEVLTKYPIVNENNFIDSRIVLVEIPDDYIALKKTDFEEALKWRLNTRKIFKEYINNRGYWITEFYSQKKDGKRRNYYLLEKKR